MILGLNLRRFKYYLSRKERAAIYEIVITYTQATYAFQRGDRLHRRLKTVPALKF